MHIYSILFLKMIDDSYKSSEIFRNFSDIINEFYEASEIDRKTKKKFLQKLIMKIFQTPSAI